MFAQWSIEKQGPIKSLVSKLEQQVRAFSRSHKPLQLAYDSLRLASWLAVVSTAKA